MKRGWLGLLLLLAAPVAAVQQIQIEVLALMPGMAVMRIDGTQRTLKTGATSPEGVRLVDADSRGATVEFGGQTQKLVIGGGAIGGGYSAPKQAEVHLFPDSMGMFRTAGSINGMPVDFMVDTGATLVSMSSVLADRLGIDYRLTGKQAYSQTASRVEKVYRVTLERVKVGEVEVRNVEATVLPGSFPTTPLLGMSFLGQLDMVREGESLTLRKKW